MIYCTSDSIYFTPRNKMQNLCNIGNIFLSTAIAICYNKSSYLKKKAKQKKLFVFKKQKTYNFKLIILFSYVTDN